MASAGGFERDVRDAERSGDGAPASRSSELVDVGIVLAVKALVSALVLRAGFYAISDDDFSRVVIAMDFAHAPRPDPSGTSWLPFPFWVTGSAMAVFGRTLAVARGVAIAEGLACAALVHRGARISGVRRSGAVLGAIVATTIPTAARLSVAFQPEALTAGFVVFAALSTQGGASRIFAACLLFAACLSRYEAWPAAAVFALLSLRDARSGRPALSAAIALAAPVLWIVHGVLHHGDALFFAHRVAAYRAALGVTEPLGKSLAAYPIAFVFAEPELVFGAAALAVLGGAAVRTRYRRPALVLAGVLSFLIVGRLVDGAPTHHIERTMLPFWAILAVVGGDAAARLFRDDRRSKLATAGAIAGLGLGVRSVYVGEPESPRGTERAIGETARAMLPADARLVVDTPDYGYFAVIAAFGAPERADPMDRRDPRLRRSVDAFESRDALVARLARSRATALVVHRTHWPVAFGVGTVVAARGDFALVATSDAASGGGDGATRRTTDR